ncbi:hypothetical protein Hanom_Chr00s000547g01649401 [Helianthus anomalus]
MSSPTPPPPPPNPTTTTATATADFLKSVARQRPRKHTHPSIYQTFYNPPFPPPPNSSRVLYPVASSGRGFIPNHQHPTSDHNLVPNSDAFPPLPASAYPYCPFASNSDASGHLGNPSHAQTAAANPKVVGPSSVAADNSLKNTRDKNGDDTFVVIRDRKVQVSEGTSLYAQCRSWLKNGLVLEKPPQYVDHVKSLPKPLPASMVEPRNDDDMETEEKTEDVEHLSAKELLQQHVKHAKKVRARLRNQRLQRIERYKDRLALLLPPVVDQQPKTDPTS